MVINRHNKSTSIKLTSFQIRHLRLLRDIPNPNPATTFIAPRAFHLVAAFCRDDVEFGFWTGIGFYIGGCDEEVGGVPEW